MFLNARIGLLCLLAWVPVGTVTAQEASVEEEREQQVMERFLTLLEKNPRRGTALDRVYGFHVERGTLDALLKTYEDRVAKDPDDGAAWMVLGLLQGQSGRDAAAVASLRKAEEVKDDDPLASYYLGQALILVGQTDAAADAFERAIARKPSRTDLLEIFQALGRIYQRAHQPEKALAVWDRLEARFPDDLRVQEQIAAALAEESEPVRALPRYEALAAKATDPYRKVQFGIEAAELKLKLGQRDQGLADFERLLGGLNPESWLYRDVRKRIEDSFLKNDDQTALAAYYEHWLKTNGEDVDAMVRLSRTLASLGRTAEARTWLDRAVKLAPSRKELRLALVEQLVQERKFTEAASQYEALAKTEPNNPDVVREWGRLLLRDTTIPEAKRKQNAANVWRRLLTARPNDSATAVQVADLLRQADLTVEAIALYKKAVELAPGSIQYHEYLGEYYHELKRPDDAHAAWAGIASGKNHNAKNLGRLAEVLAGFGDRAGALKPLTEACALEPDSFDLQFKRADLLFQLDRFDDALAQLAIAAKVGDEPEQTEAALDLEIKISQANQTLTARADALQKTLDADPDATADGWRTLARYREAEPNPVEALAAIKKAIDLDPKSVESWIVAARLYESGGNLGAAADAFRTLARLDRRTLTQSLTEVARLEVRLGRRDEALKAGRDLLAAAPGNPENYQFFADLCMQLGRSDEGIDALRRAVRVNGSDVKAVTALAEALAKEFRTEEAIELFWRAFDRADDLDGKLAAVARLAELYLQRNQFDRLIARLERERREAADTPREATICLAKAYQGAGDLASARQELERLLTSQTRDTQLLEELTNLAEAEGELSTAARYQKQKVAISNSEEDLAKLAQLYASAGEMTEAEAVWARLTAEDHDPHRVLQVIDQWLSHDDPEKVLPLTETLLRTRPDDWDALYRDGVALVKLKRPRDAARRFQQLLDLKINDDEESALAKARKKSTSGRPAGTSSTVSRNPTTVQSPFQQRVYSAYQIRAATGLEDRVGYSSTQQGTWTPADFGQARMAALAWLNVLAREDRAEEAFLDAARQASKTGDDRARRDWLALQIVRQDNREIYEAARALAIDHPADLTAQWIYLSLLSSRNVPPAGTVVVTAVRTVGLSSTPPRDDTPPLPDAEIAHVLTAFGTLQRQRPELAIEVLDSILAELKRAGREDEETGLYREAIQAANDSNSLAIALRLAAQRGEVKTLLTLCDRIERQPGGKSAPIGMLTRTLPYHLAQAMSVRATEKSYADVLTILDHGLAAARRAQADRANARRPTRTSGISANPSRLYYQIWSGTQQRSMFIDYPNVNNYIDYSSLTLLRQAFEIYKRDDLLSDLFEYIQTSIESAPEGQRAGPLLALSGLHWWNGEKDEALALLTKAVDASEDDPELRIELAGLRERRGETEDALTLIDSVEPVDQKALQERETMALRLAVVLGDVERARKAAERLFNLRLDANTQLQLAAQMHQLGMHDLAEAVLARARRHAGNQTATLVSMMNQYQQQNQPEIAAQIAYQILRKTPTTQANSPGVTNQNDSYRRQALQFLARSGKLKDRIDRLENQVVASPTSLALLESLADHYKASPDKGDKAKLKSLYERMATLRPDDASLRLQIGLQAIEEGDAALAVTHVKAAFQSEPRLLRSRLSEVQNAFIRSKKLGELGQLLEDVDLKAVGNPWTISNIVHSMMRQDALKPQAVALLKRAWTALPDHRGNLIQNLVHDDTFWMLPGVYEFAVGSLVPGEDQTRISPWYGLEEIYQRDREGKVVAVAHRVLELAARQGTIEEFAQKLKTASDRLDGWKAGKAMQALVLARQEKTVEARSMLQDLLDDQKESPIPVNARWIIGQELESIEPLKNLALAFYEQGLKDVADPNNMDYVNHPVNRLVTLYKADGRREEARALVLKFAKRNDFETTFDVGYTAYRQMTNLIQMATELTGLGYPADAVRLFNDVLNDTERLQLASRMLGDSQGDRFLSQARQGLETAVASVTPETLAEIVRALLEPRAPSRPDAPALDLMIVVQPRELDQATLTSLFEPIVTTAAARPVLLAELRGSLLKLDEAHPDDLSVQVVAALVDLAEAFPRSPRSDPSDPASQQAAEASVNRLVERIKSTPLEDLPAGVRPNARQRAEAARQIPLFLVARACEHVERLHSAAEVLADRAFEAAQRQTDSLEALAILRERGQSALDRGDRTRAERLWSLMLDQVMTGLTLRVADPSPKPMVPTITTDRFEQVAGLARLAASRGMTDLSLKAMRDSLRGGPPVRPLSPGLSSGSGMMMVLTPSVSGSGQAPSDPILQAVEARFFELDALWTRSKAEPLAVYETLRDVVLPEGRPNEIFLYARPLGEANLKTPRNVAAILVRWAVRAGQADDLRGRLDARKGQPMFRVAATVLRALLDQALNDEAAALKSLDDLERMLKQDSLQTTVELACAAALPALTDPRLAERAARVVETAARSLEAASNDQLASVLDLALGSHQLRHKQSDDGQRTLGRYLAARERWSNRYTGRTSDYYRERALQVVADEYAQVGDLPRALEFLGQLADLPATGSAAPSLGPVFASVARQLADRPAAEQFDTLKAWILPTANRRSVRLLASTVPDAAPPEVFGGAPAIAGGLLDTATLLIDSARAQGNLDSLSAEVRKAAAEQVENAQTLLCLIELARGRGVEARDALDAYREDLETKYPSQTITSGLPIDPLDLVVARACLRDPALQGPIGKPMAKTLLDAAKRINSAIHISMIQHDLAMANEAEANRPVADPGLEHWHPGAIVNATTHASGSVPASWVATDAGVEHVAGPQDQFLFFDRPLTGRFEVSADVSSSEWAEGQLSFGGMVFESSSRKERSAVSPVGGHDRLARPDVNLDDTESKHLLIQVEPGLVRMRINNAVFFEDHDPCPTAPWLALFARREQRANFRNLAITGRPEVPRVVRLTHADRLDGWVSSFYQETQPPRLSVGQPQPSVFDSANGRMTFPGPVRVDRDPDAYDWSALEGEIHGRKIHSPDSSDPAPSRLFYYRPLRDGESLSYEFYHEPGAFEVHPALDRLTFVLDPNGVRLHWMTDGLTTDPSGLAIDNLADEPKNRRGPAALPLKPNDWNAVTLQINKGVLVLQLNGTPIYERALEPANSRQFGLYHDKARTAARVRNVVLNGAWSDRIEPGSEALGVQPLSK